MGGGGRGGGSRTGKGDGVGTSEGGGNGEEGEGVSGEEMGGEKVAGGLGRETGITGKGDGAREVREAVEATEGIDSVVWQTDLPPGAEGQMMAEPTVVDGRVLLLATLTDPPDSGEAEVLIGELREDLAGIPCINLLSHVDIVYDKLALAWGVAVVLG